LSPLPSQWCFFIPQYICVHAFSRTSSPQLLPLLVFLWQCICSPSPSSRQLSALQEQWHVPQSE
jgi:hypothetical protein